MFLKIRKNNYYLRFFKKSILMGLTIINARGIVQAMEEAPELVSGRNMSVLPVIGEGWLHIESGLIHSFGKMASYTAFEGSEVIDATGRFVFPSFCDSHTHLVYAGSREIEYVDKIRGLSYEEIAQRGGGILNSAILLDETDEDELYRVSMNRIDEIIAMGTGAVEIKSGYGLNTEAELKMLRVIQRIRENAPLEVKSTFLGAHAFPQQYRSDHGRYVDMVINEMIPAVAAEELADYIDVFCDRGFFTVRETERILMAGIKYGMRPKIHANELDFSGGIQVGVKYNALSVDHLEFTGDKEIEALLGTETMPTLLPGAAFFLGMIDPPARKMIEAGLPLALASDFNPGSSPSGNMKLVISLGVVKLKMLPDRKSVV